MMENQDNITNAKNKKLSFLLIGLVLSILLVIVGLFIYNNSRLYIRSSAPENNTAIPTGTPFVEFIFNKELDVKSVENGVASDCCNLIQEVVVSGSTLRVFIETASIEDGHSYRILLNDISSTDGKILTEYIHSFRAEYVPFEELTQQEQAVAIDDVDRNLDSLDIIYDVLPYINRASNYYVDAEEGEENNIIISIKPLTGTNPVSKQNIEEAKDYLLKRGIDISLYTVVIN